MKSDVIIAMVVGFIIGTIVAVGATNIPKLLSYGNKSISAPVPTNVTEEISPSPQNNTFTLEYPKDESVSDTKIVTVSGHAKTGTNILIETDRDTKIVEATDSGSFDVPMKIAEGSNMIYITNFDTNGEIRSESRTVFYTPEDL